MTPPPDSRLTDERLQTLIDFVPVWVGGKWDREDMLEAMRELQQARLSATARDELLRSAYDVLHFCYYNASVIPDPAMDGATDCYRVPLDDIDQIPAILDLLAATVEPKK